MALDDGTKFMQPKSFYSDRAKVSTFLTKLDIIFTLNIAKYGSNTRKSLYTANYIKGIVYNQILPYIKDFLTNRNNYNDDTKYLLSDQNNLKERI